MSQTNQTAATRSEEKRLVTLALTADEAAHLMIAARGSVTLVGPAAAKALDNAAEKLQAMLATVDEASPPKMLESLFASWDREALRETIQDAHRAVCRHGNVAKARAAISDLAYGNVSVSTRNHYRPLDNVLAAMERGYA